ncbi:MAG: cytochrome b/b6 domain-containing protein [Nevskiaceae bacterium]
MNEAVGARYNAVAIVLHWAIAAAILVNLGLGWWMHRATDQAESAARAIAGFQVHKSLGLTVLVLTVVRLLWRLVHPAPPLPAAMPAWQQWAARLVQWGLYALMIVVPLSGWTYVSAQWRGDAPLSVPTLWFGLFEVPHLFDASALPAAERQAIAARNFTAHFWLAWSMGALFLAHAGAALKHRFVNRDDVMRSMLPDRRAGIAVAVVVLVFAVLAVASGWRTGAARVAVITSAPGGWVVDPASEIAFSGNHAGDEFRGRFTRWQVDLRFDLAAPANSRIEATVETGSAADGVPLHEETLPQSEWFDVANHPTATFRATRIAPRSDGAYDVVGELTIKGRRLKGLPLTLRSAGETIEITGSFEIDRADANLGMESDPEGDLVSRSVTVEVRVLARAPGAS